MTIDTLRCFLLVAENLSFARAAEALYISQPAVTKQINSLENEIGVSLFIRSTRHVELSSAGITFYRDAKEIVAKADAAMQRVRAQRDQFQSLRIGLSNSMSLSFFSGILKVFHQENPEIYPEIEMLNYKIVLNLFLEKKLDLLFYYQENMSPRKEARYRELMRDFWCCLVPAGHPLEKVPSLSLADLTEQRLLVCNPLNAPRAVAQFQNWLLEHHPASEIFYCNTVEIAHCMVSAGMGIALLPSLLCPAVADFAVLPVNGTSELSFGVFYHKGGRHDGVKRFLSSVDQYTQRYFPTGH